jgi:hypothetical protein
MIALLDAMRDPMLFGPFFAARGTGAAWETFVAAVFGLPMTEEQLDHFRAQTTRPNAPGIPAREAWVAVGRHPRHRDRR